MLLTLATLGIIGMILSGSTLAVLALRYPERNQKYELWCAGIFLGGIILLAAGFPRI